MNKLWTKEENQIIDQYFLKIKIKDLHDKHLPHRTCDAIRTQAYLLGLSKRQFFAKDELFFEIPNTINSSAAGGFASDGNLLLRKHNNYLIYNLSLEINKEDEQWINDIKNALKYTGHLYYRTRKYKIVSPKGKIYRGISNRVTLKINSAEKYIEDLNKNWNLHAGKKSLILEPPLNLDSLDIKLAYIVGLISGDGCISLYNCNKGKHKILELTLYGTENLLKWCKLTYEEYLGFFLDIKINRHNDRNTLFRLRITGENAIKLFEKMRSLNCIKLSRKWDNPVILAHIAEKRANPLFCQRLDNPKKIQNSLSQSSSFNVKDTDNVLINTV